MTRLKTAIVLGKRLAYAEYGRIGGKPLIYLHGWPGSRYQAMPADAIAKECGIHILAPDRPGMGRSDLDSQRHILDWPQVVTALCGSLGWDRFSILAVSGGAPYALACAMGVTNRLERVGVCSGVPHPDWLRHAAGKSILRNVIAMASHRSLGLVTTLWLLRSYMHLIPGSSFLRPVMVALSDSDRRTLMRRDARDAVAASVREAFRGPIQGLQHDLQLLVSDWGFTLGDVSFPVRWWHGTDDVLCPLSEVEPLAAANPAITLAVVDEGHYSLPLNRISEVLEWFARGTTAPVGGS